MQSPLKYGLVAAFVMSIWTLGEYALDLHTSRLALGYYTAWGTHFIMIVVLWRLLLQQVRQPHRLWLPVWEGLLYGTLASVVAAMGFCLFCFLYLHFLNPEYPYLVLDWKITQLRAAAIPEENIRTMARSFLWSMGPVGLPVTLISQHLLLAVIASPILTLWLNWRHKEPVRTR